MKRSIQLFSALVLTLGISAGATGTTHASVGGGAGRGTPPAGGAGGNSVAAHSCQIGNYATLERYNGTGFTNTGECASYAAHGGTLFNPTVIASVIPCSQVPYVSPDCVYGAKLVGTGFHPNSLITESITYITPANGGGPYTFPGSYTDGSGTFVDINLYENCVMNFGPYSGPVQYSVTLTDAQGVTRTTTLNATCP